MSKKQIFEKFYEVKTYELISKRTNAENIEILKKNCGISSLYERGKQFQGKIENNSFDIRLNLKVSFIFIISLLINFLPENTSSYLINGRFIDSNKIIIKLERIKKSAILLFLFLFLFLLYFFFGEVVTFLSLFVIGFIILLSPKDTEEMSREALRQLFDAQETSA